ncbi:Dihydrofolate reductase [compost metagenome]
MVRAEHWAREQGAGELMLIGGAQLYQQALPLAARLYLTRVALNPEGDAWFPAFSEADWQRDALEAHPATADTPAYTFETWLRD